MSGGVSSTTAESVKDPERNVPRATLVGVVATDAARSVWGDWAGGAVAVGAILSTFGCLNGWILLTGQMPFAAARDRPFPTRFARLNRYGAPAFGIVVSSALLVVFIAAFYNKGQVARFSDYILLATTTTLIAYLYEFRTPTHV